MLRKLVFIGLTIVFVVYMAGSHVSASDEKELEKKSDLVAKLLVSCSAIIAQQQDLFNNPEIGDKGFTGDVYVSEAIEHFKNATGVDISLDDASSSDQTKEMLGTLLVSTKKVIDESQRVMNMKGHGFKNVVPAIVGKRTGYKYNIAMGVGYHLKQTSARSGNPSNNPDTFERNALREFKAPGYPKGQGYGKVVTTSDGSKVYRYMLPVYIKPACLKCHGGPKGEKDIAEWIKEGYKEGELIGAISVMIPCE